MVWFKHYTNCHKSSYYQKVYEHFGKVEGHGLITLFVSFFADKYDPKNGVKFRIRLKELQNFMEISPKKLRNFLEIPSKSENLTIKLFDNFVEIDFPKLLNLQDEYSRKSGQAPDKCPDNIAQKRREEKRREKNIKSNNKIITCNVAEKSTKLPAQKSRVDLNSVEEVFKNIPDQTIQRWQTLYNDAEYLKREFVKAVGWYLDNGNKKPKSIRGWCQALSSWFERGWHKHAKFTKGNGVDMTWTLDLESEDT